MGVTIDCASSQDPAYLASFKCITGPSTFSALISNQLLLPEAQAAVTPQRIVVQGVITNDILASLGGYTFAEGSEIIFANLQSGVTVGVNSKLTLDNTQVKGCESMWRSILVQVNGQLIVKNDCEFKHALKAIEASHGAYISITDCNFSNNVLAVKLGGASIGNVKQPVYFTSGGGIWGNNITGGALKSPYLGNRGLAGISCENISEMTIGNNTQRTNDFHDILRNFSDLTYIENCSGIYARNSDLTIIKTKFSNIGLRFNSNDDPNKEDAAISAINKSKIKLVGAGISSDGISIGNGGIYLLGSSADVSNVRFLDNRYGLLYETPVAKSPTNFLKINGCKFEGFYLNAVEASSGSKLGLSILEIMNNIFEDDNINYNTRTYVDIHSADATDGTNYKITDNQFFNRDRPNQNAFQITGIRIINLHKGFIARNLLINEEFSPFYGGSSDGCEDVHWDSNNFTGAGSGATTLTEAGLLVSNSCFCKYSCNEFNQIQYGAYFLDNNDVSVLTHNTFNMNGFAGLGLSQENTATHIGPQDRRNNHWNNSAAHYEYLNFDPGLNSHLSQVERSLFNIQYEEILGTSLWAVPRTIDIVDDVAAHIWFKFKPFLPGDPQPSNPCAPNEYSDPNNDLNDLDYSIINGTFQPWNGYAADTWETSFYLYKRLSDYPTLLTPGSPQETWYNNHYNGTLGKLSRAFADFVDLSLDAPNTIGEQLLNDINSIPVGTTYEQNLKTCLGIFVERYLSATGTTTPLQTMELNAVADQCRTEGGLGVVLARLALSQTSNRANDCAGSGARMSRRNSDSANLIKVSIAPNPATSAFTIQFEKPVTDAIVKMYDVNGQLKGIWQAAGNQYTCQLTANLSGLYFLEVSEQGKVVSRNKILISH